jgi:hypothetical protein
MAALNRRLTRLAPLYLAALAEQRLDDAVDLEGKIAEWGKNVPGPGMVSVRIDDLDALLHDTPAMSAARIRIVNALYLARTDRYLADRDADRDAAEASTRTP